MGKGAWASVNLTVSLQSQSQSSSTGCWEHSSVLSGDPKTWVSLNANMSDEHWRLWEPEEKAVLEGMRTARLPKLGVIGVHGDRYNEGCVSRKANFLGHHRVSLVLGHVFERNNGVWALGEIRKSKTSLKCIVH